MGGEREREQQKIKRDRARERESRIERKREREQEREREVRSPINPVWGGYGLSFDTPPYRGPGPVKEDMV